MQFALLFFTLSLVNYLYYWYVISLSYLNYNIISNCKEAIFVIFLSNFNFYLYAAIFPKFLYIISIIIPNIAPYVRFIVIILITIILGSLQLTFSRVLFFSWELVFAAFCSHPQIPVMNESWRISRMAGGKKISQPMQELLEDDDVAGVRGVGPKEETTTRAVGDAWKPKRTGEVSADDVGISYDWSKPL